MKSGGLHDRSTKIDANPKPLFAQWRWPGYNGAIVQAYIQLERI
jgi:hypothetical protein